MAEKEAEALSAVASTGQAPGPSVLGLYALFDTRDLSEPELPR